LCDATRKNLEESLLYGVPMPVCPRCCGLLAVAMVTGLASESWVSAQVRTRKGPPLKPATLILPADVAWEATLGTPTGWPTLVAHQAVVPTVDGLRAFEHETGSPLWTVPLDSRAFPTSAGPWVIAADHTSVVALDPATGDTRWARPLRGVRRLAGSADTVYVSTDHDLAALEAMTGNTTWSKTVDGITGLAIGAAALTLVANSRVVLLDRRDGKELWARALPGALTAPAWSGDILAVGSSARLAWGLDSKSGRIKWTWRLPSPVVGVAGDSARVYLTSLDTLLRAVNRDNGHQLWQQDLGTRPVDAPLVLDGAVLVSGLRPAVSAFEGRTGTAIGSFDPPGAGSVTTVVGPPLVTPVLRPGAVALVQLLRDGRLIGLRPTGLVVRELPPSPLPTLPGRTLPRERLPLPGP
jgi:outer membrane protein assembly factor BamB